MFNIHSNNDWDITLSTVPVTSQGTVTIDENTLTGFREAIFRDGGLTTNGHARGKIYSGERDKYSS